MSVSLKWGLKQVKRKALVVIIILLLILGLAGCKEENKSKNLASKNLIKQYDWKQNAKVPKDKKKLLSKVVENGEVIKKFNYNEQGQLISKWEKKDDGTIRQIKYFYNQQDKLKKKKIKEKNREEYNEILVTNKYNDQGKLVKQDRYLLPTGEGKKKRIGGKKKKYDEDGRLIHKNVVNERKNINKEWNYKYNKYDKLIFKQIKSHGKVKLLKEYTNEQEPKILKEKEIKNGTIYRFDEYKYNDQGELVKKIDKSDPDEVRKISYYYNDKGLIKAKKNRVKGEVKYIEKNYYDENGELKKKKKFNNYYDYKEIIKYKGSEVLTKGFTNGKLGLKIVAIYDNKNRPIRFYNNDIEDNERKLTEYKYNIQNDIEWICELENKTIWKYKFDFDRKHKLIKITKKNNNREKVAKTYFKYNNSDRKINCKISHFFDDQSKYKEVVSIEETSAKRKPFNWHGSNVDRTDLGYNNATIHFGQNKVISSDGYYYDKIGNKLYEWDSHNNKELKYDYIYK